MERAVLVCKTDTIQATDLPPSLQRVDTTNTHVEGLSYQSMVENFERELIIDALKKFKGNKSKASEYLNATQRIIGYKIQTLGINISKFKSKSL
jgi:Nif-specific regulatory protein